MLDDASCTVEERLKSVKFHENNRPRKKIITNMLSSDSNGFDTFRSYIYKLRSLIEPSAISSDGWKLAAEKALGTEPYRFLRRSVHVETLRAHGIFFTAPNLAKRIADNIESSISKKKVKKLYASIPHVGAATFCLPLHRGYHFYQASRRHWAYGG
jgi:hypothetical protein